MFASKLLTSNTSAQTGPRFLGIPRKRKIRFHEIFESSFIRFIFTVICVNCTWHYVSQQFHILIDYFIFFLCLSSHVVLWYEWKDAFLLRWPRFSKFDRSLAWSFTFLYFSRAHNCQPVQFLTIAIPIAIYLLQGYLNLIA